MFGVENKSIITSCRKGDWVYTSEVKGSVGTTFLLWYIECNLLDRCFAVEILNYIEILKTKLNVSMLLCRPHRLTVMDYIYGILSCYFFVGLLDDT